MDATRNLALLLASVVAWLAAWPLVVALTPGAARNTRLDWYQLGGYALIALSASAALVVEPMRFDLAAAPGPLTVALVYAFFGFMVATSLLMLGARVELRSIWAHHGVFALLPLAAVTGGYWVEVYAWLLLTQVTGAVHPLARLVQNAPGSTDDQRFLVRRLEWMMLALVRGVIATAVTLAFVIGQLSHRSYPDAWYAVGLAGLTLAVVGFPIFWLGPLAAIAVRRRLHHRRLRLASRTPAVSSLRTAASRPN
jgi:hypothetical protein